MGEIHPEGIVVVQVKMISNYIITCMVPLLFLINTNSHDMQYYSNKQSFVLFFSPFINLINIVPNSQQTMFSKVVAST
jgi:hypothetical protein